jgi:hypothetical protein
METIVFKKFHRCQLKDKAKNKDEFFPVHAMKAYGAVEV